MNADHDLIGYFEPLLTLDDHERPILDAIASKLTRQEIGDLGDLIYQMHEAGRARGERDLIDATQRRLEALDGTDE